MLAELAEQALKRPYVMLKDVCGNPFPCAEFTAHGHTVHVDAALLKQSTLALLGKSAVEILVEEMRLLMDGRYGSTH